MLAHLGYGEILPVLELVICLTSPQGTEKQKTSLLPSPEPTAQWDLAHFRAGLTQVTSRMLQAQLQSCGD